MAGITTTENYPEAMADVPGICELPLTRAVVQYRDIHELHHPGGRIQDIGLAVVVEGRYASSVRAMDLGSAEAKYLDLSSELVILDWVYDPTLAYLRARDAAAERGDSRGDEAPRDGRASGRVRERARVREPLRRYCFDLALRVLDRRGFSPLTRPILLRIGFRDLCRDLDFHESTVVRIVTGRRAVTRVHLDYDANALVFSTADPRAGRALEGVLSETFPGLDVRPARPGSRGRGVARQVRFGIPATFAGLRRSLQVMRRGLGQVVARFEPERFNAVRGLVSTFGERSTLDRFDFPGVDEIDAATRSGLGATGMAVH